MAEDSIRQRDMVAFGRYVLRARVDANLTQRKAAGLLGVDHTYLSKIENAQTEGFPSADLCRRMARLYDVDPDIMVLNARKIPGWLHDLLCNNPDMVLEMKETHLESLRVIANGS